MVSTTKRKHILIDAGLSLKTIVEALVRCKISPESICAIVVTHEHSDHIKSVGTFSRKYDIPVYANAGTWTGMERTRMGEIAPKNVRVFETNRDFFIEGVEIMPFSIPHDTLEPVGFSFFADGVRLSVATDIGHITPQVEAVLSGSDLLLIESNHDIEMLKNGSYPYPQKKRILGERGHLSNDACAKLLTRLYTTGVTRAILGHLSPNNNTEELAVHTTTNALVECDIQRGQFELSVAHRDKISAIFEV